MTKQYPSKQYLSEVISNREFADSVPPEIVIVMARQLLAGLEQEPVAYIDPFSLRNFATYREGKTDNKRMGREWMWANPDSGLVPVYTAQPAPSAPSESAIFDAAIDICRKSDAIDEHAWNYGVLAVMSAFSHCRAAMLQSLGNSEQLNSPVTPDQPLAWKVIFTMHGQPGSNFKKIFDDEVAMESAVSLHRSGGFNVQVIPLIAHQNQ